MRTKTNRVIPRETPITAKRALKHIASASSNKQDNMANTYHTEWYHHYNGIEVIDYSELCHGSEYFKEISNTDWCQYEQAVPSYTTEQYTDQSRNVIYLISSAGMNYVGKTTQTLSQRMSQHRHAIKAGYGDGAKFIRHFQKYNFEDTKIKVLDSSKDPHELHEKERYWIAYYRSDEIGLNSTK